MNQRMCKFEILLIERIFRDFFEIQMKCLKNIYNDCVKILIFCYFYFRKKELQCAFQFLIILKVIIFIFLKQIKLSQKRLYSLQVFSFLFCILKIHAYAVFIRRGLTRSISYFVLLSNDQTFTDLFDFILNIILFKKSSSIFYYATLCFL